MPRRIAFATSSDFAHLTDDDRRLVPLLAEHGIAAEPAVWSEPAIDWKAYDAVLIRSIWDYYLRLPEFLAWLDRLDALGVPTHNPTSVLRWNADKVYLRTLAERGVATLPTRWIPRGTATEEALAAILAEPWPELILKPSVSAGADHTVRLRREEVRDRADLIAEILGQATLLAQPFAPEIVAEGEWSFLFFGGELSHAVLKSPRAGDFRVQPNHGGVQRAEAAPPALLSQARAVLGALDATPLYARVDGVRRGDAFLLMELEIIEPYLYLGDDPPSAARFARAIARALGAAR